jgi:hypothetical protein
LPEHCSLLTLNLSHSLFPPHPPFFDLFDLFDLSDLSNNVLRDTSTKNKLLAIKMIKRVVIKKTVRQIFGAILTAVLAGSMMASAESSPLVKLDITAKEPNEIGFKARAAKYVRFMIHATSTSQPCIDELEVYAEGDKRNLALASNGSKEKPPLR